MEAMESSSAVASPGIAAEARGSAAKLVPSGGLVVGGGPDQPTTSAAHVLRAPPEVPAGVEGADLEPARQRGVE